MAALVTASEVKTYALLNPSFDSNLITDYYIKEAEKKHLKYYLTENLFNAVVITPASYTNLISGVDYTYAGYERRYEGIKKCLSYFTMYEILPFIWTQVAKNGIFKNNIETAVAVSQSEYDQIRGQFMLLGQKEGKLIQEYLMNEIDNYPLFMGFGFSLKDGFYNINNNLTGQTEILGGMIL